jgi:transcription elongation GreA/GreB family factor
MNSKLLLDEKGLRQYQDKLKQEEQKLADMQLYKGNAILQGDTWHDNFAFEQLRVQEISQIKIISDLKKQLDNVTIVDKHNIKDMIDLDCIIKTQLTYDINDIEVITVKLIGGIPLLDDEVSINSPLGQSIYMKKIRDSGWFEVNERKIEFRIIDFK